MHRCFVSLVVTVRRRRQQLGDNVDATGRSFGSRIANRLPPPAGSPRCHQGPKSARETARRDETREDRGVEAALRRGMARRGAAVAEHVYESRECA